MHLAHERPTRRPPRRGRISAGLIVGVVLAASGLAVALSHGADTRYARVLESCRDSRAPRYLNCVNAAVLEYAYRHPQTTGALLGYVSEHAAHGGRNVDLRRLSDTAHYAGMELAARHLGLGQALGDCGDAFKAACMHGFVMDKLDRAQLPRAGLVRGLLDFCLPVKHDSGYFENCLHAVGHELWARTRLSLNDTLALCDALQRATDLTACWSGVLMEYSKDDPVRGRHAHTPAGKRTLPCGSLASRFQAVCTYAEASYRQYIPGWEPPRVTYERCAAAAPAYRLRCMTLVSERLLIARAGSARLADSVCAQLPSDRALCLRSTALLAGAGDG